MSVASQETIAAQLRSALDGDALPLECRDVGQRLLAHLKKPTQITVIGLRKSGKTSLVNMLLGDPVMPDIDGVPIVELVYGDATRIVFESYGGSLQYSDDAIEDMRVPQDTIRVCLELPNKSLQDKSFVEIGLPDAGAEQLKIMDWATQRSDILIWCSQKFEDRELTLWASAPDQLKDHSFLALTMADRLHMKGELADRIAHLEPLVAEEFLCLYPVATQQAIAARAPGAEVNTGLWQSSGGKALNDGVQGQIDSGRMADMDQAHMLLGRFNIETSPQGQNPDRLPAGNDAAQVMPGAADARESSGQPEPDALLESALALLQDCADELMTDCTNATADSADRVLERCTQTAEAVAALLSDAQSDDPQFSAIREDAMEGEQMVLLFQLERGENAASDAVTVLLQMKKEMSGRMYG